jgi:hypothetical protein
MRSWSALSGVADAIQAQNATGVIMSTGKFTDTLRPGTEVAFARETRTDQ